MFKLSPLLYVLKLICNTTILILFQLNLAQASSTQGNQAQVLFETHRDSIYQIRIIELSTDNKTTIGSGFLATQSEYMVTNYHVVSQIIQEPSRYRIESVARDGGIDNLQVVDIDVVHDIAILKGTENHNRYIPLSHETLTKGARIFSLGNPHDLGMSVVEGTFNGLLENSMYEKIFVSASVNAGMSGGPTIDQAGRVIGINVSSAGEQLSFLVPVKYLNALLSELVIRKINSNIDFHQRIEQQLINYQSSYISTMLAAKWEHTNLGPASLPNKISEMLKCWGDSSDDKDSLITHAYSTCESQDSIFLSTEFTTGGIGYTYDLYSSKDLSTLHFYNIYSRYFGSTMQMNRVEKDQVGEYSCNTQFVDIENNTWKIAFCVRNYKKYQALYDVVTSMALLGKSDQGLVINLGLSGVSKNLSLAFVKRFMEEVRWPKL